MSLLEKATLITTPTAHSDGVLHSIKGGSVADFDVVRGSAATRVNAEGLIEDIATNIPRIDYTEGTASILLEPQSTNLIVNSELNNVENIVVSAVSHTISFYGTGSITLSGTHAATLSGTGANDRVTLTFTPSAGTLICTDSGSVDKKQVEALSYSTSYIPTSGAIATRLADSVTGAGDATTFNSTEGVLYAEMVALADDSTTRNISLSDGTYANSVLLRYLDLSNKIQAVVRIGNSFKGICEFVLADTTENIKVAYKWKNGDFALWINGTEVDTSLDVGEFAPNILTELSFNGNNLPYYGKVKDLRTYNTALSDAELTELTTI